MITMLSDSLLRASVNASLHFGSKPSPGPSLDQLKDQKPVAPTGINGVDTIVGWVKYGCLVVCLVALIAAGAAVAFGARQGEGGHEAAKKVVMPMVGVMIVTGGGAAMAYLAGQ